MRKERSVSYGNSSIKTINEESMVWPFHSIWMFASHLEQVTGTFILIFSLNLLLIAINFLLYGNFEIFSLGNNYFIRSVDTFLKFEATRLFFKENLGIEKFVFPFFGYLVRKVFILLGV